MRTMKSRRARIAIALTAGLLLAVAVPLAAEAATSSGTRGCGAQYGYLTVSGTATVTTQPPGSVYIYSHYTSGTYTDEAAYASGVGKTGGGYWAGSTGGTGITANPSCQSYG